MHTHNRPNECNYFPSLFSHVIPNPIMRYGLLHFGPISVGRSALKDKLRFLSIIDTVAVSLDGL